VIDNRDKVMGMIKGMLSQAQPFLARLQRLFDSFARGGITRERFDKVCVLKKEGEMTLRSYFENSPPPTSASS
jgi:hypothetical protein